MLSVHAAGHLMTLRAELGKLARAYVAAGTTQDFLRVTARTWLLLQESGPEVLRDLRIERDAQAAMTITECERIWRLVR